MVVCFWSASSQTLETPKQSAKHSNGGQAPAGGAGHGPLCGRLRTAGGSGPPALAALTRLQPVRRRRAHHAPGVPGEACGPFAGAAVCALAPTTFPLVRRPPVAA